MTHVLITGANRGIGLHLVEEYAADGARVYACCRAPKDAGTLAAFAEKSKGAVSLHPLDVSDPGSIASLRSSFSSTPLDILINNAGVSGGPRQSLDNLDYAEFAPTFAVNTLGPLRMTQAFRPNLMAGGQKKLVTMTSELGSITNNTGGFIIYRASKAAVNQIMKGLSHELVRDGIVCALVHPGWVKTDMGGPGAPVMPRDSARGIKRVIHTLTPENTGIFLDFEGRRLPW